MKTKQKCQLYNTISVEARNKYCEYLDALEPVINDKGKKVVYFDEFMSSIRSQAVKDAKIMEQQLLDNGMCTRDWSIEQIKELYTFNESGALSTIPGTPKEYYEFGNPRYNFSYLGMISQLRIVAENQFNNTAQSNSALYDFITNIKSISLEASESNISRIWNISNSYSQIHCNPWYNGHSVKIEYR